MGLLAAGEYLMYGDARDKMEKKLQEKELMSNPATPHGTTPPRTPGDPSPPIFSPGILTPGQYSPRPASHTPTSTRPPSNLASPTIPRSPRFRSPRFLTPLGTPMRKVFTSMKQYLEDIGHITKLNPHDAWLPVTESRNGNAFYSAFHNLNAGIGFQALLLPVAFTFLGWSWGIITLLFAFIWQLYTLWILIKLHEAVPGTRYNRYVELAKAAFGERLGPGLVIFPVFNLSAGTASSLIIIGGSTLKLFYEVVCGPTCQNGPLTAFEWYLVFAVLCAIVAQLPNLNSIAYVSLIGAVMAVAYTTMVWTLSISKARPEGISYEIVRPESSTATAFSVLNALGLIAFAFRGHNLVLEIQATMPSTLKHPSHVPMWKGAKGAYAVVAFCYFPMAIGGYWAYGNKMLPSGILSSLSVYHQDISPVLLGLTFLFVVLSSLSSFQIYSISVFDSFEQTYSGKTNKPCPKLVRLAFRLFFVFFSYFIGIALPFLASLGGLFGGLTSIPVTFMYPCFMWLSIKKPSKYSLSWYLNWTLGILGIVFMIAISTGGVWSVIYTGLKVRFFKPL
ncbi:hypothetical protein O6H91_09G043600 [Diphasiastrum complanatum]|uniref:Uncharacterized protein n=7 Tax=Diphasiastrum complanatum TaxID=34168 RepID=A0ACC2CNK2_DIPCM|nr:hypothetical protein O6H91_09G018100 [Diphasiastrum complanatum]KAJ7542932.1 hypothetical protein O6H91_09G018100 [Diphasiastrum complanatum]KAJ7542933.1 hypothetical protein O6H91_09G018100 [Diphasiastrum complanatum]KAJ7543570.1 hypothetical protein O6H91_09G043600 [Diphasiastrum complanatum]KAJ7543571.1 hypothetical protein O6H91_09G043600 [Diphasiastrum complanatum]